MKMLHTLLAGGLLAVASVFATVSSGGFSDGFVERRVDFVHLEYHGAGWDDGMARDEAAGRNFLQRFRELSGGARVADRATSTNLESLANANVALMPPLIYMTGSQKIGIDEAQRTTLRRYIVNGGTLLADCGGPEWDKSFRKFATELVPELKLEEVANDDPLFSTPFAFASGAPSLWHHGGKRMLGMKHKGRWILLYHPGDLNDAWKTGRSGLDKTVAESAFHLGVNVFYQAYVNHFRETWKWRKPRGSGVLLSELPDKIDPEPVPVPSDMELKASQLHRQDTVTKRITEKAKPDEIPVTPDPDPADLDEAMKTDE